MVLSVSTWKSRCEKSPESILWMRNSTVLQVHLLKPTAIIVILLLLSPKATAFALPLYKRSLNWNGYGKKWIRTSWFAVWLRLDVSCWAKMLVCMHYAAYILQCESKKISPQDLWQFFQNGWEFFNRILHAYYGFLSMLDYEFLFNYLQLWQSYATLSVTTQFTSCAQKSTISRNAFSDIFPKQLGIFSPNFIRLLYVLIYAGLQIFIQLSATLTKLCHIKRDHHNVLKMSTRGGFFWLTLYIGCMCCELVESFCG